MPTLSPSERLLKTVCASCLILAPAVLLVGGVIHPEETSDATRQFGIITDHLGRWEAAHWLVAGSMVLMAGVVVGLAHLLHEARPGEGIIGGATTMVGVMALVAVASTEAAIIPHIGRSGDARLFERIAQSGDYWVLLGPVMLLPLGLIIMSYGMFRSRVVQPWVAGSVAVGAVFFAIALPTGSPVAFTIGLVLLLVGLAPIGWNVLSESDEQWDHPPQVGTQPAA